MGADFFTRDESVLTWGKCKPSGRSCLPGRGQQRIKPEYLISTRPAHVVIWRHIGHRLLFSINVFRLSGKKTLKIKIYYNDKYEIAVSIHADDVCLILA